MRLLHFIVIRPECSRLPHSSICDANDAKSVGGYRLTTVQIDGERVCVCVSCESVVSCIRLHLNSTRFIIPWSAHKSRVDAYNMCVCLYI